MPRPRPRRRLLLPTLLLGGALAALAGGWSLESRERRADLMVGHRAEVFTLDPQRMSYQQDLRVGMALFEGLVTLDPRECRPMPATAERWETSPDGRTLTFHLRTDARWSNGDPVVAEDFREGWLRAILPDAAADYTGQFFLIDGAEELFEWRNDALAAFARGERDRWPDAAALAEATRERFDQFVGLSAPDPHTLVVRLRQPTPYFLDLLALSVFSPVHRPTLARFTSVDPASGRFQTDHAWTRPGTLVSNGPYVLERWRYKRDLRLRRNPMYWDAKSVKAEVIDIVPMEDSNTAVLAFGSGEFDWLADVVVEYRADLLEERSRYEAEHAEALERARASGASEDQAIASLPAPRARDGQRRDIRAFDAFGTDFFSFNCRPTLADGRPNPLADPAVRRAFARSVDKDLLVRSVTRLNERTSGSLTPPGSIPGYAPPKGLPFDVASARAELASAGWEDRNGDGLVEDAQGNRFPTVDLLYSTGNPRYEDLSLALRDMWQRALGVQVELRAKEGKFYKDDLKSGNFMVARGGWYGDFGDPMAYLMLSRTGDGNNDRGYTNPRYDAMLDEADAQVDPARRLELLAEAERFLLEVEPPLVPLCTYKTIYMYRPGELRGLCEHPRLEQYLGRMSVDRTDSQR